MARKSRKVEQQVLAENVMDDAFYQVAFYLRLSDKDLREGNSSSIENQRELLADFVKNKPDLQWKATFIDDGKTGTNFKRSGFEQMMDAVKQGKINCIIVKDLSRFGRNYLEAGNYIEHIFPFMNVRFIAVTDEFDTLTATPTQLAYLIPLKNIMNENYARDISKKERSAKKVLRKNGCFLGAYAVYGYRKIENKHMIEIDPEVAGNVKTMFDMCEEGYSDIAIAKYLNRNKIDCPAGYKYKKGILKHEKYAGMSVWYPQTVAGILNNRAYIGDLVQGVYVSKEMRGKRKVMPKEEWDIVPDHHEPIISLEQFDRVQKLRQARREKNQKIMERKVRQDAGRTCNILKGKLYCGDCKKAMVRIYVSSCKDKYRYICDVHDRTGCCQHKYLAEQELLRTLKCVTGKHLETICEIKNWLNIITHGEDNILGRWEEEERTLAKKLRRLNGEKAAIYKDWKEGILDDAEYSFMKSRNEKSAEECMKQRSEIMYKKEEYILAYTDENPAIKATEGISAADELTEKMVAQLIKRIEVYSGNRIVVHFYFQDEFERLLEMYRGTPDDGNGAEEAAG